MSSKPDKKKGKNKDDAKAVAAEDPDHEGADGEAVEGAEGAEELDLDGKKKGLKPVIMIIIALVLLAAAGAGIYFSGVLDPLLGIKHEGDAEGGKEGGHEKKAEGKKGGHGEEGEEGGSAFMALPDLIVNLSTNQGQPRYLKLKIQLELADAADQAAVEKIAPRVIDHFQTYLRELRVSDLRGSAGIYRLRQELLARVNAAAAPIEVKDVLFQEILIQ